MICLCKMVGYESVKRSRTLLSKRDHVKDIGNDDDNDNNNNSPSGTFYLANLVVL